MASRAWSGLIDNTAVPEVRSFKLLEDAEAFLGTAGGGRAVGFFGKVEAIEQTIFLTVAKQLTSESAFEPPQLGRATVGRGTSGTTIYAAPRSTALAPNGSAVLGVLMHEFRVPESAEDPELPARWQRTVAAGKPPSAAEKPTAPLPPPRDMWQAVLEAEALLLHQFLQRASLPDVSDLRGESTLIALTESADRLGLLLFPPATMASYRQYHLRRLGRVAARFSPIGCMEGVWKGNGGAKGDGHTAGSSSKGGKGGSGNGGSGRSAGWLNKWADGGDGPGWWLPQRRYITKPIQRQHTDSTSAYSLALALALAFAFAFAFAFALTLTLAQRVGSISRAWL